MAWDTFARRRIDLVGRTDRGDEVIAHEFDYAKEKQARSGRGRGLEKAQGRTVVSVALCSRCQGEAGAQRARAQFRGSAGEDDCVCGRM